MDNPIILLVFDILEKSIVHTKSTPISPISNSYIRVV